CRTFHSRVGEAAGEAWRAPAASAERGTVTTTAFRFTRKTWPQVVHLTVIPASVTRPSSSSYSVLHFSQRTSIEPWLLALFRSRSPYPKTRHRTTALLTLRRSPRAARPARRRGARHRPLPPSSWWCHR